MQTISRLAESATAAGTITTLAGAAGRERSVSDIEY
jgi:hypothetical protein